MINHQNKQEGQAQNGDVEGEEYRQAMQHFTRSLYRAGVGLALIPVSMLPRETQEHFKVAGREFRHGVAKLARKLADRLDETVNAN